MPARYLAAAAALALAAAATAQQPPPPGPPLAPPGCAGCAYGPHTEVVRTPAYAAKPEPFCLRRVSLAGLFRELCGRGCYDGCEPVRSRNRLVKWEVTREEVRVKCMVEPGPAGPACVPPLPSVPVPVPVDPLPPPLPPPGPDRLP
jgi:hypothetical protein